MPITSGRPDGESEHPDRQEPIASTDRADPGAERRRRRRRRLRVLLGFTTLLLLFVGFSQLDPELVKKLGPVAESWYDLLHAPDDRPLTLSGQRMVDELKALGGHANVVERTPGLFGLLGRKELFSIGFPAQFPGDAGPFGDDDLARLVDRYGDRIWGLDLSNTRVTDAGLRHLAKLTDIRHVGLGEEGPWPVSREPVPETGRITDAGLVHLRGLKTLQSLHIRGLPITDAGLEHLGGLTGLHNLALQRTRVEGPGLAHLRALPQLGYLMLDGSPVTAKGLGELSGLRMLGLASLNGVPLSDEHLAALKALPTLSYVEVRGCGLTDEQVKDLQASCPSLKIER